MRAVQVVELGGAPQLAEVPEPRGQDGEVLVRVDFAGVNPLDARVAAGRAGAVALPLTLGCEGAGRTAAGERVLVYGHGLGLTRPGTYAEAVAVPAGATVPIPDGVASEQAAAVGVAAVTAFGALEDAGVGAGDCVVVLGAAGGVGSVALQLARARGARAVAQTSQEGRAQWLREQADEVVVAGAGDLGTALREVRPTVVLDGLGGPFTGAAAAALRTGGRHVLYGASAGRTGELDLLGLYRRAVRLHGYASMLGDTREAARACLEALARGELHIPLEVVPLADAAAAHDRLAAREVCGKLVLATA